VLSFFAAAGLYFMMSVAHTLTEVLIASTVRAMMMMTMMMMMMMVMMMTFLRRREGSS
jgi:hypothetical protein